MGAQGSRLQEPQQPSAPQTAPPSEPTEPIEAPTQVMAPTEAPVTTEPPLPTASWNLDGSDDSDMTLESAGFGAHMIVRPKQLPPLAQAHYNKNILVSYVLCLPTTTGTSDRIFTRTDQPMHFVQCEFYSRSTKGWGDAEDYGDVLDFARRVHMTDSNRRMEAGGKNLFLCFDKAGALVQTVFVKGHDCKVLVSGRLDNFPPTEDEVKNKVLFPLRPPNFQETPGSDNKYVKAVMSAMYFMSPNEGIWMEDIEKYGNRIKEAKDDAIRPPETDDERNYVSIARSIARIKPPGTYQTRTEAGRPELPPKACFALESAGKYYVFASKYHYLHGHTKTYNYFFTFLYDCETMGSYCVPVSYINDNKRLSKFEIEDTFTYNRVHTGGSGPASRPQLLPPHQLLPPLLLAAVAVASTLAM